MKFFLPDSQDLVDPSFDFQSERRSMTRLRQRDDLYAHEIFGEPAFDGILVSKGIVDGIGGTGSRYSIAQRHRLLRVGAREFFRTAGAKWGDFPIMGDCGAFTYVKEERPPYSVDDVIRYYVDCGFDYGISVDHVILEYKANLGVEDGPADARKRQAITLELASEFLNAHRRDRLRFVPLGVAQGWSPPSYAHALKALQKMGYQYIAVGGMVPLKTPEVLASLEAMSAVRKPRTKLHLLGVTRTEQMTRFASFGVASFDSTSPLRQAFKDDKDNYYTPDRTFTAIRIPQVEGNPKLLKAISSGVVSQDKARMLERECLDAMRRFDADELDVEQVLDSLRRYGELCEPGKDQSEAYAETLAARPWKACPCDVCKSLGHHVILFRGAERNRRRGFHNIWVFYRRIQRDVLQRAPAAKTSRGVRRTPRQEQESTA